MQKRVETVVAALRAGGGDVASVIGNLSSDNGAQTVFEAAHAAFGGIDILVSNAGGYVNRAWFDTTPESWRAFYEEDVLSAVRLILLAAPAMRDSGWGRIINITTGMASVPQPAMPDYAAAKAALVNASVSLAKTLAGTGITVNAIAPGLIATDGVEVGDFVAFIASPRADYIHGANLRIDGGMVPSVN